MAPPFAILITAAGSFQLRALKAKILLRWPDFDDFNKS